MFEIDFIQVGVDITFTNVHKLDMRQSIMLCGHNFYWALIIE